MGSKQRNKPQTELLTPQDFQHLLSAEDFAALMVELEKPLKPAFRVNPMKVNVAEASQAWAAQYGWRLSPVIYCPTGWWVEETPAPVRVSQTLEHRLGQYYIQDAASMLPVELFDWNFEGGEENLQHPLVLDMAASPGGKTTHLSAKMRDQGFLLANDSSRERLTALRLVLQNWGAVNAAISNFPGERFGEWFPNTFDRVLLDAPCSMQGLRTTESHPMRPISVRERGQLSGRQARLLASALRAVRPGGQVVYSTCTLTSEEDEGVLQSVLEQFGPAISIADVTQRLPLPAPALPGDGVRMFSKEVRGAARLWPHRFGTSGFFAALIVKNESLPGDEQEAPERPLQRAGLFPLSSMDARRLAEGLQAQFAFDLDAVVWEYRLALWRLGNNILALPDALLQRLPNFPVHSAGLAVGEETIDGFVVGHDWLVRFFPLFQDGRLTLDESQTSNWLRGEDLHGLEGEGLRIVLDPLGRLIGRGRLMHGRLKNLLPRRWLQ